MHDVVIIGAGPGGSAAAYYLARQGLDILLLDKAEFPRDKTCGDGLTPRALKVIKDMGLLNDLLRVGYRVNGLKIAAPKGHTVEAPFPDLSGQPGYTLIVPRLTLDHTILNHALKNGAALESSFRVTQVAPARDSVIITGKQRGRVMTIKARLAMIATGGASIPLLLQMGLLKKAPPVAVAARAYFEGVEGLTDQLQLRFDGVPLPGYGWVFPLPNGAANVGAGIFPTRWGRWRAASAARTAYDAFVQAPALQLMLRGARQVGPVKGYPLRMDFTTAPTYGERVLLLGEAAGLVNPLTGEGIDYALESGKLAAEHMLKMFRVDDISPAALAAYDPLLRQQFQRLFIICGWIRDLFVNPLLINPLVSAAIRRPDLKLALINIAFGQADLNHLSTRQILRRVFNWGTS